MHTTTTTRRTVRTLARALLARGFRPGAPNRLPDVTRHLERTFFASNMACRMCGHVGMHWRPFHRGRSYRPLWACRACGAAHEDYQPVWANPACAVASLFPRRVPA